MKRGYRVLLGVLVTVGLVVALALPAPGANPSLAANGIVYVDADASGANDGSSWQDAYTDFQAALDAVRPGGEVWVAEGIYKPTQLFSSGDPRSASFQMRGGVALYGGFDPSVGDTEWDDRNWELNSTILSGDIGTQGDDSDNSYHVFYHPAGTDLDGSSVLDGFTITGGNANGETPPHRDGGGMYNDGSSPMLANCAFLVNSAAYNGAAMLNTYSSSPTLTNCAFVGNSAGSGGGMANSNVSWPTLTNCTFDGNSADYGGGMYNETVSLPSLANVTFTGNWADSGGGVFNYDASSPVLTNCTFEGNSATWGGGAVFNASDSSPVLTNCILWGNTSPEIDNQGGTPVVNYCDVQGGYQGEGNINSDPLFVNAAGGDYHLSLGSPCIDVGDNEAPNVPDHDIDGDARILDGDGNVSRIVDMGVDEVAVDWPYFHDFLPMVRRGY